MGRGEPADRGGNAHSDRRNGIDPSPERTPNGTGRLARDAGIPGAFRKGPEMGGAARTSAGSDRDRRCRRPEELDLAFRPAPPSHSHRLDRHPIQRLRPLRRPPDPEFLPRTRPLSLHHPPPPVEKERGTLVEFIVSGHVDPRQSRLRVHVVRAAHRREKYVAEPADAVDGRGEIDSGCGCSFHAGDG